MLSLAKRAPQVVQEALFKLLLPSPRRLGFCGKPLTLSCQELPRTLDSRLVCADTDLVDNVEDVEENFSQEEDDGVALEPFNLEQERQQGHFDEGGNYVEDKADDEEKDAWLTSDGMQVVVAGLQQAHLVGLNAHI